MNLPKLTAVKQERITYLKNAKPLVETLDEVRIELSDGSGIQIAANTPLPDIDMPEMRALAEYMKLKGYKTIGDAAVLTTIAKADYESAEVVTSVLKVAVVEVSK